MIIHLVNKLHKNLLPSWSFFVHCLYRWKRSYVTYALTSWVFWINISFPAPQLVNQKCSTTKCKICFSCQIVWMHCSMVFSVTTWVNCWVIWYYLILIEAHYFFHSCSLANCVLRVMCKYVCGVLPNYGGSFIITMNLKAVKIFLQPSHYFTKNIAFRKVA